MCVLGALDEASASGKLITYPKPRSSPNSAFHHSPWIVTNSLLWAMNMRAGDD